MRVTGQFCVQPAAPFDDVPLRRVAIPRDNGETDSLIAPTDWPMTASQTLAALDDPDAPAIASPDMPHCLTAHRPPSESAVLRTIDRLAARWTAWGWRLGLFDQDDDAAAFFDDARWLLAHRRMAPDPAAWRGINRAAPALGFAVDPFTGTMASAADLPGFSPAGHISEPVGSTLDNVVALIRSTATAQTAPTIPSDLPCPVLSIDLLAFVGDDGHPDLALLAHAVRLAALAAEIELSTRLYRTETIARAVHAYRPIAITPANIASFVLSQGLPHDSAAARNLVQATVGLVTAAVASASAEIAEECGACPGFATARTAVTATLAAQRDASVSAAERTATIARPGHLNALAQTIMTLSSTFWANVLDGTRTGLRHTGFTALGSHRTDPMTPLTLLSYGGAALPSLTQDLELANGSQISRVTPGLDQGLIALGYGLSVRAAAIRHLRGRRLLAGAPGVNTDRLRELGLDDEGLARLEAAMADTADFRSVFTGWVLGDARCRALGLDPDRCKDYGFDMLGALGFSPDTIAAASRYCMGARSLAGTPGLSDADAAALSPDPNNASASEAHMVAALNNVVSRPLALHGPQTTADKLAAETRTRREMPAAAPTLATVGQA